MKAILDGGPYDGVELDHNDINLYTGFNPIGSRQFLTMPPLKHWDAVRRGEKDKGGPFDDSCPVYELVDTDQGVRGRYDASAKIFVDAIREYQEGRQPIPEVEFTGHYFECYRGDMRDVRLPENYFTVTDEKDRRWVCVPVSREYVDSGVGFKAMMSMMGKGEPLTEPLRSATVLCDDAVELPAKLADFID